LQQSANATANANATTSANGNSSCYTIPVTTAADDSKYVTIKSNDWNFLQKTTPDKDVFTEVGKTIKKETFMCNGNNEAFQ
jgi:hypothetical protein